MPKITVEAPAKLNLHLHIGGKQPSGFHEIESLFLALAFGDTLCVETAPQPLSLAICMNWQLKPSLAEGQIPLPLEKNSISRAVSLFRDRTGCDKGLKITVEKRIPLGSGLGGGSSDAAAALLALNRLFSAASDGGGLLTHAELVKMGESLGSDVPFFLYSAISAAWVSGRGEKIQPVELPKSFQNLSFVLVNPGFPSDTTEAYRLLDWYRKTYIPNNLSQRRQDAEESESFANYPQPSAPLRLGGNSFEDNFWSTSPHNWPFFNDFLPVFQAETGKSLALSEAGTVYQLIISCFRELGADFAGLSGSGATCFGVFSDSGRAELAAASLTKRWPIVINTFLLAHRTML